MPKTYTHSYKRYPLSYSDPMFAVDCRCTFPHQDLQSTWNIFHPPLDLIGCKSQDHQLEGHGQFQRFLICQAFTAALPQQAEAKATHTQLRCQVPLEGFSLRLNWCRASWTHVHNKKKRKNERKPGWSSFSSLKRLRWLGGYTHIFRHTQNHKLYNYIYIYTVYVCIQIYIYIYIY